MKATYRRRSAESAGDDEPNEGHKAEQSFERNEHCWIGAWFERRVRRCELRLLSPVQSTFILPVTLSLRLDTINAYLNSAGNSSSDVAGSDMVPSVLPKKFASVDNRSVPRRRGRGFKSTASREEVLAPK
jgi:hypothetical protein